MNGGEISTNHTIYRGSGNINLGADWWPYYLYYRTKDKGCIYDRPLGQGGGVYVSGHGVLTCPVAL